MEKRLRLTDSGTALESRVRSGLGSYSEEVDMNKLSFLLRRSPDLDRMDLVSPALEGTLNKFISKGLLEVYEDEVLDWIETEFSRLEEKEYLIEGEIFTIPEKGESLLDNLSNWKDVSPRLKRVGYYLDQIKTDKGIPGYAVKGLVKDGFLKKEEI